MGLDSPVPRSRMPYSVSMPHTFAIAMRVRPYPRAVATGTSIPGLQVLPGCDPLDGSATGGLLALRHEHPQEDDALALLARDLRPVVGVGAVGQVFVLLVLLPDRALEIVETDALPLARDVALDGELLGPAHDVLDHGSGREVLEGHDLLV